MNCFSSRWRILIALLAVFALFAAACGDDGDGGDSTDSPSSSGAAPSADDPGGDEGSGDRAIVGLITKNNTNPFFVKMAEGANAAADEAGLDLRTFAGEDDSDNAAQVRAIEDLISVGAAGFMITASDTEAIVPAIERAREAGLVVIALDTPVEPITATDATFATDNFRAGELIGEWALAQLDDPSSAKIALLNINASQPTVGVLRNQGFLQGFGVDLGDPDKWGDEDDSRIVGHDVTEGSIEGGRTAMENLLALDPDINVVYTLNEPAAEGARLAMEAAGRSGNSYVLVSVDGSCAGVRAVANGDLGATSMQFPLLMASLGVEAIASGEIPPNSPGIDFFNTGVELITDGAGVDGSKSSAWGLDNCWGDDPGGDEGSGDRAIVGLITKNNTNPFFVKMAEGANAAADEAGLDLRTFAGEDDSDNAAQVRAIEDLISVGAAGFMITASDTEAIVPAIERAREAGLVVIALDTPVEPITATDATFATDNFRAGELIGEWALAQLDDPSSAKIALLNINASQPTVGVLRNQGFLQGFGVDLGDPDKWGDEDDSRIVGHDVTEGSIEGGRTAMENLLALDPDINVVYTLNEPAAEGARLAMEAAGRSGNSYVLVSVDGSCAGVRAVANGDLGATSMQFPLLMASLGVEAIASGEIPPNSPGIDFFNTGVELITDGAGVDGSKSSAWGLDNCWG